MDEMQRMQAQMAAGQVANRAKLLREARQGFRRSDAINLLFAVMWWAFAFWTLRDIKTYKTYDMQKLRPMYLLSPALYFALGLMSLNQVWLAMLLRRVDALAKLLADRDVT